MVNWILNRLLPSELESLGFYCFFFFGEISIDNSMVSMRYLQCGYCNRGHPDKVNQSQSRMETINFNICYFSQWNVEYVTKKLQLLHSPRKHINAKYFGCMALDFQLTSIASLLSLSSIAFWKSCRHLVAVSMETLVFTCKFFQFLLK